MSFGLDEAFAFKRLADGYVFRAPSRSLFGRPEHYRVDAARKDTIAVALAEMRIRRASMVIVALAAAFAWLISAITFRNQLPAVVASGAVFAVLLVVITRLRERRLLQPLLSDLPRTSERITFRDRLIVLSLATPHKQLWLVIVLSGSLAVFHMLRLLGYIDSTDARTLGVNSVVSGLSVVLFTVIVVIFGIIAVAKVTRRGDGGGRGGSAAINGAISSQSRAVSAERSACSPSTRP